MEQFNHGAAASPRCATGVPGLDDVLHGGLIPGPALPGRRRPRRGQDDAGAAVPARGRRGAASGACTSRCPRRASELAAGARSHGWSLDGIEIVELIADERELDGDGELTMYHPSEVELDETTRQVLEAVERCKPQRMVLDSLSELRLLAQSSLRYRRQILALKQFFVGRNCTVLLLDDRTAEGPDLQLQSIAHGVISLDAACPGLRAGAAPAAAS